MTHVVGSHTRLRRRLAAVAGIPLGLVAVVAGAPYSDAAPEPQYAAVAIARVRDIDTSFGISPVGLVAVTSRLSSTGLSGGLLSNGNANFKLQPRPGDQTSTVVAINERGDSVGSSAAVPGAVPRPVFYPAGSAVPQPVPSAFNDDVVTTLTSISGDLMVGYSVNAASRFRPLIISNRPGEGFIATPLATSALVANAFPLAINGERVVGVAQMTDGNFLAMEFHKADPPVSLGLLDPGGVGSKAMALNETGVIVGSAWGADGVEHAATFAGDEATKLGELPGDTRSVANAINSLGDVVGQSCNATTCRAAMWSAGQVIDLSARVPVGFVLKNGTGINDDGQIATTGTITGGQRAIILSKTHSTSIKTTAVLSNLAKMTATLTTDLGKPLVYAPVVFKSGSRLLCVGVTDLGGKATCNQTLSALLSFGYRVEYAGNAIYLPSAVNGKVL